MKQIGADDPEAKSADIVAGNVEQLKALFPESVTEGNIDFAVLRQLLGDAVDEREEKYGLNWHGKRRARQLALTPSTGTLRPCPEESVDWDTTQNLMIEGDNLEVLKLLQKSYAGKIKLIYIDPPYNTGKDFVYKDDYQDNIKNYLMLTGQVDSDGRKISSNAESSGRFHTDWLSMMYPRLLLARTLLSQTGVILLSIDDGELGSLMKILTEIFGEENFVGTLVWKGATDNNPTQIAIEHEYLVCFARAKESVAAVWKNSADAAKATLLSEYDRIKMRGISADLEQAELRSFIRANREALTSVTHYDRVDAQGVYTGSRKVHNPKPGGYVYDVMHPVTGTPCARPVNGYRYPKPAMDELLANNRILFGEHETQIIQIKEYLIDFEGKLSSVLHLDSRTGANELNDLFGVQKLFPSPKPVALLTDIFEFILGPGDLVLDFFAGSGSTCHAAWKLNSLDGGDRRCVLMQLPQPLDPDDKEQSTASSYCDQMVRPRILSELTKERLRRAGAKVKDDNPMFAGDTGFRVFKLASSNIQQWDPNRDDIATSLEASVEHLKTDRTEADILYELLLKRGLDLCVPIEKREIAGKEVHAVGGGVLLACLTGTITKDDAEALALGIVEWHAALAPAGETTCVFRDSAFEDDVAKSNVAAILEQHGLTSVKSL